MRAIRCPVRHQAKPAPHPHRLAAITALGFAASACTAIYHGGGPPTVVYDTPFGSSTVAPGGQPQQAAEAPLAVPPGNLGVAAPATPRSRDGVYTGTAIPLDTGGGICINNQPVTGFRVHGNAVRWGLFRGTIQDNALQMVNGNVWVIGQFEDGQFSGQISRDSLIGGPGCSYLVRLANASH